MVNFNYYYWERFKLWQQGHNIPGNIIAASNRKLSYCETEPTHFFLFCKTTYESGLKTIP